MTNSKTPVEAYANHCHAAAESLADAEGLRPNDPYALALVAVAQVHATLAAAAATACKVNELWEKRTP